MSSDPKTPLTPEQDAAIQQKWNDFATAADAAKPTFDGIRDMLGAAREDIRAENARVKAAQAESKVRRASEPGMVDMLKSAIQGLRGSGTQSESAGGQDPNGPPNGRGGRGR